MGIERVHPVKRLAPFFSDPVRIFAILGPVIAALAILWFGLQLRASGMIPARTALAYQNDYDEGVNLGVGQLMLQGMTPYHDFFYTHPPLAVLLFTAIARLHNVPWGDTITFVSARYVTLACGILVLAVTLVLGQQLGGILAGFLAMALLAVDATMIEIDRRVMLEPYMNLLSLLTVLCYVLALSRPHRRNLFLFLAGVFGACALLVKTVGALAPGAVLIYAFGLLLGTLFGLHNPAQRSAVRDAFSARLKDILYIVGGVIPTFILIVGYFVYTAPASFLREVYLFQLLRPADGIAPGWDRFVQSLGADGSHLTTYLAATGICIIVLRGLLRHCWGQWGVVLIWAGLILGLFAVTPTFFPHYFVQLAVPLSLLGGALASRESPGHSPLSSDRTSKSFRIVLGVQIVSVLVLGVTNWQAAQTQYQAAVQVQAIQSATLRDVSSEIAKRTLPNARVFALEPLYNLAASREPAEFSDGQPLLDSYGYMQYVSLGMDQTDWTPDNSKPALMDLLRGDDAQEKIQEAASHSDYILVENRARWQLTPETLALITRGWHVVYRYNNIQLYARN